MTSLACHPSGSTDTPVGQQRIALVGSPNAGKTSVFNHLTGIRARTGNYPGVTVARSVGTGRYRCPHGTTKFTVEDLPGSYSLHPVSRDEHVVADLLHGELPGIAAPDALAVVVDATVLERSLSLVAQVLRLDRPTMVTLTMTDKLANRGAHIDVDRLANALGIPVVGVVGSRGKGFEPLRELLAAPEKWTRVPIPPPRDDAEFNSWVSSVLTAAQYRAPETDKRSARIDRVLAMAAREVFVATMGQIFAASDPENPIEAVRTAVYTSGPHQGELVFSAPTVVALLVFFAFALLCMSTVATIRRETNSWRWPIVAWVYMFALAWIGGVAARYLTLWITG